MANTDFAGKVGFAIGTGRCGTLFLYQLMDKEPAVASSHERNPDNETFHRFCQWHGLPVDDGGFLYAKDREIRADLAQKAYSFEASPYLSISVRQLYERFGAKFVLVVRRPDRVVTSFVHKGFYKRTYQVENVDLATGYQDQSPEKVHTFFARIAPRGPFLRTWNDMSQVGRVAWFWRAWNERTLEELDKLPKEAWRLQRIEDFDHAAYCDTARWLGYQPQVTQADFDALSESKPHAFWRKRNIDQWTAQEVGEFEGQVGDLATKLGYDWRIAGLVDEARAEREAAMAAGHIPQPKKGPQMWRLRRSTADLLRGIGKGFENVAKGVDVE